MQTEATKQKPFLYCCQLICLCSWPVHVTGLLLPFPISWSIKTSTISSPDGLFPMICSFYLVFVCYPPWLPQERHSPENSFSSGQHRVGRLRHQQLLPWSHQHTHISQASRSPMPGDQLTPQRAMQQLPPNPKTPCSSNFHCPVTSIRCGVFQPLTFCHSAVNLEARY